MSEGSAPRSCRRGARWRYTHPPDTQCPVPGLPGWKPEGRTNTPSTGLGDSYRGVCTGNPAGLQLGVRLLARSVGAASALIPARQGRFGGWDAPTLSRVPRWLAQPGTARQAGLSGLSPETSRPEAPSGRPGRASAWKGEARTSKASPPPTSSEGRRGSPAPRRPSARLGPLAPRAGRG